MYTDGVTDGYASGTSDGWDRAREFLTPPAQGTGTSMSVGIPASTYNQGSSYNFTVDVDNSYAYIKNSLGQTVARKTNSAYDAGSRYGWSLAEGKVGDDFDYDDDLISLTVPSTSYNQGRTMSYDASWIRTAGYDSAKLSTLSWDGNSCTITKTTSGQDSRTFSVTATKSISYNTSTHRYEGSCYANVSGTTRHTSSYTSGTEAYVAGGDVTGFSITTPSGASNGGHTNNSDGYELVGSGSSANAYVVVKGAITTAGGGSQNKNSYLQSAPTKLYRKGYSDGTTAANAAYTQFRGPDSGEYCMLYYQYNGSYVQAGNHKWYYK